MSLLSIPIHAKRTAIPVLKGEVTFNRSNTEGIPRVDVIMGCARFTIHTEEAKLGFLVVREEVVVPNLAPDPYQMFMALVVGRPYADDQQTWVSLGADCKPFPTKPGSADTFVKKLDAYSPNVSALDGVRTGVKFREMVVNCPDESQETVFSQTGARVLHYAVEIGMMDL